MPDPGDIKARIREPWLVLSPRADRTDEAGYNVLDKTVDMLAIMATQPGTPPTEDQLRSYRSTSRSTALRELDRIADALDEAERGLRRTTKGLHKTTIVALADVHIMRSDLERMGESCATMARTVRSAKTQVPDRPPRRGRPTNIRAHAVAGVVISGYEELFEQPIGQFSRARDYALWSRIFSRS